MNLITDRAVVIHIEHVDDNVCVDRVSSIRDDQLQFVFTDCFSIQCPLHANHTQVIDGELIEAITICSQVNQTE